MKALLTGRVRRTLAMFAHHIGQSAPPPPYPVLRLWERDLPFNDLWQQIAARTLVDQVRCFMLYQYAHHVSGLPGAIAEVGVYKGGTGRLLAQAVNRVAKDIHLFDTFYGMPPTDPIKDPCYKEGDFGDVTIDDVTAYLRDCARVHIHEGYFPTTAATLAHQHFCLIHVDVDIYRSVMDSCSFFYPRLVPGGIMVFDDYGFDCPGAKMAVDEYFADKPERPCYLPTGQCTVTRLPACPGTGRGS
jgi:O-methyltransferase